MGKTVTSYPPTRGESSLESIKGAELPQRFIFGLCAGKTKQGKAGEAGCRDKSRQPAAEGPRGCQLCARCQHTLEGVSLGQVSWWADQWTPVCCDNKKQTGKGRGGGVAASLALPRIPGVISGELLPVLGLDPLSEQKQNQDSSPLSLRSLGRRGKQRGLQINTRRSRPSQPLDKMRIPWEFPGGPVARTRLSHSCGAGSIPGRGTEILQAVPHSKRKKKREREKET